jgi:hypothetical protein
MARTLLMRRKICPVQTQGDDAATFEPNTLPGRQLKGNIRAEKTITDISWAYEKRAEKRPKNCKIFRHFGRR